MASEGGSRAALVLKRLFDTVGAAGLLLVLLPVVALIAVAIKLDSRGPVFYRCRRVGHRGRELWMLKFRKMVDGARGPALTAVGDTRFTRIGTLLAKTKLDEIPQLWNVIKGEMSFVGPRPEDPHYVGTDPEGFAPVLSVRPGITGLSQLAFAKESEVLARQGEGDDYYVLKILPQKLALDRLYVSSVSTRSDLRILAWTTVAVLLRRNVAVNRHTGALGLRRRPAPQERPAMEMAS